MRTSPSSIIALTAPLLFFGSMRANAVGPNAGGTLILHTNPNLVYCQGLGYCGQSGISSCTEAITRHDGGENALFFTLAAFPAASSPRLSGVVFTLDYDDAQIGVFDFGACGDFELHSSDWPAQGSYIGITWNAAQTDHLVEVCWFAGYAYEPSTPTTFGMTGSRGANCCFADDSVPSQLDEIVAFGALGFNEPGALPCPGETPVGACCTGCGCIVLTQAECTAQGGIYQGDYVSCSQADCVAHTGACCVYGDCYIYPCSYCENLGGEFLGGGSTCVPFPCGQLTTGACCLYNGDCVVLTESDCAGVGGSYQGDDSTCDSDPCPPPVPVNRATWGQIKDRYR